MRTCLSVLLCGLCLFFLVSLLIYPVIAQETDASLDNNLNWGGSESGTTGISQINTALSQVEENRPPAILPAITITQPDYVIPVVRDVYNGSCPIGTEGAPFLKDPGYKSGALCRGACGEDCDPARCEDYYSGDEMVRDADGNMVAPVDTNSYVKFVGNGYCVYPNTVVCKTHKGCREHDACCDWCADKNNELGMIGMMGACHMKCHYACLAEYGFNDCFLWADQLGRIASPFQTIGETLYPVPYDSGPMIFSDPPEFHELPTKKSVGNTANEDNGEIKMPTGCSTYQYNGGPISIGNY